MNFTEKIAKGVNTIANGVFGNVETKGQAQYIILEMIQMSCLMYQRDEEFKKWIDYVGDRKNHDSLNKSQPIPLRK